MRKTTKSILSMVLSAAMVLSLGSGMKLVSADDAAAPAKKLDTTFKAYLMQNNSKIFDSTEEITDANGIKMSGVVGQSAEISTAGTYTVTGAAVDSSTNILDPDEGVQYIGLEFASLGMKVGADGTKEFIAPTTFSIKPKTISVTHADDSVDTYDWSKLGDGSDNGLYNNGAKMPTSGQLRMGIINAYAGNKAAEYPHANPFLVKQANSNTWTPDNVYKIDEQGNRVKAEDGIPVEADDIFAVTFEVTDEAPVVTPTPVPTATITPTEPPAAKEYKAYLGFQTDNYLFRDEWHKTESNKYYNHDTQICLSENKKGRAINATIANATISDNTTYTVSISGVNMQTIKSTDKDSKAATGFYMLYVDTNIPLAMKGVSAVNASLKIDGKVVKEGMTLPCKPDADGYYQLMLADGYSRDMEDAYKKQVPYPATGDSGNYTDLKTIPTSNIEITFTMKGINFKQDFNKKTIGPAKGKTFSKGNLKYKVTKVATETAGKKKAGTVSVVGLSKKGKKAKKLSVPATVKNTGSYKVNKLGNNVFKGAKATQITLGKTIKKIPAGAFANCKKLKALKLNAKLSSVNKKAFKGCKKTIKISGKSKKANLKKIKKAYKKAK